MWFVITFLAFLFVARLFYVVGLRVAAVQIEDELRRLGYKPGEPLVRCTRTDGHDGPCNGLPRAACVAEIVPAGTRQPHELDTFGNCPECTEIGARAHASNFGNPHG